MMASVDGEIGQGMEAGQQRSRLDTPEGEWKGLTAGTEQDRQQSGWPRERAGELLAKGRTTRPSLQTARLVLSAKDSALQ
jgi:hypothetical protein